MEINLLQRRAPWSSWRSTFHTQSKLLVSPHNPGVGKAHLQPSAIPAEDALWHWQTQGCSRSWNRAVLRRRRPCLAQGDRAWATGLCRGAEGTQSLYSLNPSSMEKRGCVSVPFGRRLFWESLPELLLVLMLCDNNLSCLLLVYAGHEKALCAARGAGCQLGAVRRSLCAPRLQPPQQNPSQVVWGYP